MAGHGGGAWKVAYADFVTAMMAFFLVMWITAQSKQVKEAIAHYFNEPSSAETHSARPDKSRAPAAPPPSKEADPSKAKSPTLPGAKLMDSARLPNGDRKGNRINKPSLSVLHSGQRQMDGAVVFFADDSSELTAAACEQLRRLAPVVLGKRIKIEVRGHATRRPLPAGSPFRDAWQLSYARCVSVMNTLVKLGIEADRIRLSQAGPFEPYTLSVAQDKSSQNSRVEVYVLDEAIDDLVGTPEERAERFAIP